jgi:hypothetical protein
MYTPSLSDFSVISLRRFAWAMGITMGKAFDYMVCIMPAVVDSNIVCQCCKDNTKCSSCTFKTTVSGSEKAALTAI